MVLDGLKERVNEMKEIFKKSFLEGYASYDVNAMTVLVCMIIASILGIYIFYVYRMVCKKQFYNKTFNVALPSILLITAAVTLTIQSNIVVSLGMVGALSIVRFRTAIKDPADLVFLFWSISCGIICGAGVAEIAVILSIVLTALTVVLYRIPSMKPMLLLVINAASLDVQKEIVSIIEKHCSYYKVKARNGAKNCLDMVVEIKTSEEEQLIKALTDLTLVNSASILQHDGEVTF